jgi:Peptidase family M1 domain
MRTWIVRLSLLAVLVVAFLVANSGRSSPTVAQGPTLQPTETAAPLTTPTPLPATAAIDVPSVDWSDVSVHKQAMKAGFENDVDAFINANRYLIIASLSFEPDAVIRGGLRVRYTNQSQDTLSLVVFRLYPNGPTLGGRSNVTAVSVNGQTVEPSFSELRSVMGVPLPTPLKPGEAAEFVVQFSTIMTKGLFTAYGRFGFVNDVVSSTAWYPTLSVYEPARGWWTTLPVPTGDPGYSETGLYDVRLTMPSDLTVAMSGTIIEQKDNGNGTITYRDVTGPMRDHAFQASKRYMITSTVQDGTTINIVHYRDKLGDAGDGTADAVKFSAASVKVFNQVFGDYPYKELDVVQNPTPSGVEFPGLVQIAQDSWRKGVPFLEIVIAHEVGHQWFYGLVGNNQVEHPWLDESLTSFTDVVYMRAIYAGTDRVANHEDWFRGQYNNFTGSGQDNLPLNMPVASFFNAAYGAIIYRKGPVFYMELERQLGSETVYKALNLYYKRFKYQVVVSSDFLKVLEEVSGKQLDAVFAEWVGAYDSDPLPSTRLKYFAPAKAS